jgi:hypothetical protein
MLSVSVALVDHTSRVIADYRANGVDAEAVELARLLVSGARFMARKVAPELAGPAPPPLARSRAKLPYKDSELEAYFALARAQPTEARRQRLTGLLCLGLGAGIQAEDLRYVTGNHLRQSHGALVVVLEGPHPRRVPVLARYEEKLKASALYAGSGFICGGVSAIRKNLTNDGAHRNSPELLTEIHQLSPRRVGCVMVTLRGRTSFCHAL